MDTWPFHLSAPVALAAVAAIGYLVGRRTRTAAQNVAVQSQRELRRAQSVARELEQIAVAVRKHLAKHHASLNRFKQRVGQFGSGRQEVNWTQLCQEAEGILKPTLQLASQIANAYDQIRQQSNSLMTFAEVRTDQLTGVSNRLALDETIRAQLALMSRYDSAFSVALFDVDHFNRVNDEQGHLQGDRILRDLAGILNESARETDLVGRYGGEEFLVVMPQTDLDGASLFSERMRQRIELELPVTISGGVAVALAGDSPDLLLTRADAALYSAKTAGRNCIFRHDGDQIESIGKLGATAPI